MKGLSENDKKEFEEDIAEVLCKYKEKGYSFLEVTLYFFDLHDRMKEKLVSLRKAK